LKARKKISKLLTLKHIGGAPVAQLDRASGYEPSRRKLISAAFGVAHTRAHRVSAPSIGPKLDRGQSNWTLTIWQRMPPFKNINASVAREREWSQAKLAAQVW